MYVLHVPAANLTAKELEGLTLISLKPADHAALALGVGERKATELCWRLDKCFGVGAVVGNAVVAYSWMTVHPRLGEGEPPFLYDVAPKQGWAYLFDTWVAPPYRGRGVGTALKILLIKECRGRGIDYCVCTHDAGNKQVIRVSERLGFKLHGQIEYHRLLDIARRSLAGLPEGIRR